MITDKTECNNPPFGRILTAMVTPFTENGDVDYELAIKLSNCLLYTSPSPRDAQLSRMPSSA